MFVGNLKSEVNNTTLENLFKHYGELVSIKLLQGPNMSRYSFIQVRFSPSMHSFVLHELTNGCSLQFKKREAAEKAKAELQGRDLFGKPLRVGWKNPILNDTSVTFNAEEGYLLITPSVAAKHGIKVTFFAICYNYVMI